MTSKTVWIIACISMLLSVFGLIALSILRSQMISLVRLKSLDSIEVVVFSSSNQGQFIKMPFYIKDQELQEIFGLQSSTNLVEIRKNLLLEISSTHDPEWLKFSILDETNNHLNLYHRYCREFLINPSLFPNTTLTTKSAQIFIKKFEAIKSCQEKCNAVAQTFAIAIALVAIFMISIALMLYCSYRIIKLYKVEPPVINILSSAPIQNIQLSTTDEISLNLNI